MKAATHPVSEEVMALLDGELSIDCAKAIAAHLDECKECEVIKAALVGTSRSLAEWTVTTVPSRLEKQVFTALTREEAQSAGVGSPGLSVGLRWTWKRRVLTFATAGFAFFVLLAISVPNLLRSRMAANEASAVGSLKTLNTAAIVYSTAYGHFPRALQNLGGSANDKPSQEAAGLIDPMLAAGKKSGYSFFFHSIPPDDRNGFGSYTIDAYPTEPLKTGVRHFSTDQTGEIFVDGKRFNGPILEAAQERNKTPFDEGLPVGKDGSHSNAPMIARVASLSIFVKDFDAGRASLDAILARHNGYAANLNVSTPQAAGRTLQASLRIPAPQLTAAISELKALGRVENEAQSGEEVTQQHADLVARLKSSRETEQQLQDVLRSRTGKVKDVLEVEQEIARVRGETEQMEAEQKALEHRVDFASIDLKLSEEYKAQLNTPAPSVGMQLRNAGINGFRSAFESFLGILLFLAEAGPSIVLWLTILGFPAWLLWRRYRRAQETGTLVGA